MNFGVSTHLILTWLTTKRYLIVGRQYAYYWSRDAEAEALISIRVGCVCFGRYLGSSSRKNVAAIMVVPRWTKQCFLVWRSVSVMQSLCLSDGAGENGSVTTCRLIEKGPFTDSRRLRWYVAWVEREKDVAWKAPVYCKKKEEVYLSNDRKLLLFTWFFKRSTSFSLRFIFSKGCLYICCCDKQKSLKTSIYRYQFHPRKQ